MVMADVLRRAAGPLARLSWFITYSDNIGGLLPSNTDAAAIAESLTHEFATHGAGPFRLKSSTPVPLWKPFRFLGYWYVKPPMKEARAFLPYDIWTLKKIEFTAGFDDARTEQEMWKVCTRLVSYCKAFELALEARILLRKVRNFMLAELERGKMPVRLNKGAIVKDTIQTSNKLMGRRPLRRLKRATGGLGTHCGSAPIASGRP
jgi:hypothetical protein